MSRKSVFERSGDGSREENASKQESRPPFRFNRNGRGSSQPHADRVTEITRQIRFSVRHSPRLFGEVAMKFCLVLAVMILSSGAQAGDAVSLGILAATSQAGDTPCGTWQAQGNRGSVRIEQCGPALCGYVFDPSTAAKGEAILINMRPRAEAEWSGQIYSLASGGIYHARMTMPSPNTLR